jgi:hypothetical protein
MALFKTTKWKWWQLGALKLSVLSLGLIVGSVWPEVFLPYLAELIVLMALTGFYVALHYFKH